jgi:hypothetical protein
LGSRQGVFLPPAGHAGSAWVRCFPCGHSGLSRTESAGCSGPGATREVTSPAQVQRCWAQPATAVHARPLPAAAASCTLRWHCWLDQLSPSRSPALSGSRLETWGTFQHLHHPGRVSAYHRPPFAMAFCFGAAVLWTLYWERFHFLHLIKNT